MPTLKINSQGGLDFLDTETGRTLSLRGGNEGFVHKLLETIQHSVQTFHHHIPVLDSEGNLLNSVNEAQQALLDGKLQVNPFTNGRTIVSHVDRGTPVIYLWDAEEGELHKMGQPVGNNFLELTGANYIELGGNGGMFDFNKDWFVSVQCLTLHANNQFQGLFSLGDNSFNFLTGGTNYGVYLDDIEPVTQGGSARSNTWHDPETLRILLNYNATTQRLEYWTGAQGGNPTKIKDLDVNLYQRNYGTGTLYENQPADAKLCIGKGLSGSGNLRGQINDFIGGTTFLGETTINNMFNATRDDLVVMPQVEFHASIGEDTHPAVSCTGGLDGTVVGGTSDDFKPVVPS